MYGQYMGDIGCIALSDAAVNGAFISLTELDIGCNYIGDDGLKTFARRCTEGAFASLRKFNFSINKIGLLGMQDSKNSRQL